VRVFDETGASVPNQEVTVTDDVGSELGRGTTDIEGKAVIKINAEGNFNVNAGAFGTVAVVASFTGAVEVTIGAPRISRAYFSTYLTNAYTIKTTLSNDITLYFVSNTKDNGA
jgi:hypothetical protein